MPGGEQIRDLAVMAAEIRDSSDWAALYFSSLCFYTKAPGVGTVATS